MKIQILTLDKQFIVIDSEVPFMLVANPVVSYIQGVPQFPEDGNLRGTDYCNRRAGAWQINAWKLLSKQDFPLRPVFTLALVYDDTDNPTIDIRYSDLNLGEGLAGINGQLVTIDPRDFAPIVTSLSAQTADLQSSLSAQTADLSNFLSLSGGIPASSDDFFIRDFLPENVSVGKIFCSTAWSAINFGAFLPRESREVNCFFIFKALTDCYFHFIDRLFFILKGSLFSFHGHYSPADSFYAFGFLCPRAFVFQSNDPNFSIPFSQFSDFLGFETSWSGSASYASFLSRFGLMVFGGEARVEGLFGI